MNEHTGVLVVAEASALGLRATSLELVTVAKKLGGPVVCLLFGANRSDAAAALARTGVERVLLVDQPGLTHPSAEAATSIIAAAIHHANPALVLMLNSTLAAEYAPTLAARLAIALISDAFEIRKEGAAIVATVPALGGRLQTDVTLSAEPLHLISLRAGAFEKAVAVDESCPIEPLQVELGELDHRVKVISVAAQEASGVGLEAAGIVVAGGRGLKDRASFALIEQLATALGGAVGATRAVTDLGWRPHSEQIGQTGKTVSPKLYIAAGISGAVQHTVGMSGAENVVAINRDPDAPIFKSASFGIVGDLFEVLPALTAAISATRTSISRTAHG